MSMTPDLIEKIAGSVRRYLTENTGFSVEESDGRVAACYGGNWIYLSPQELATAALAVALEEIGGMIDQIITAEYTTDQPLGSLKKRIACGIIADDIRARIAEIKAALPLTR